MKRISREVSIFNLSMMDVISGAMGAFLILVVILSRHYNSEIINTERILELQKQLVEATGSLTSVSEMITGDTSDTSLIEQSLESARANVERSKAYVRQISDELDAANARIAQQQEEIAYLEDRLAAHKLYYVMVKWQCDAVADVDIYLWNDLFTRETATQASRQMAPFHPGQRQTNLFSSELEQGLSNTRFGVEVWAHSRSTIDMIGKLYYSLDMDNRPYPDCTVSSWLVTTDGTTPIDRVSLNDAQPWMFVGNLTVDDQRRVGFAPADDAERRAEHEAIRSRLDTLRGGH